MCVLDCTHPRTRSNYDALQTQPFASTPRSLTLLDLASAWQPWHCACLFCYFVQCELDFRHPKIPQHAVGPASLRLASFLSLRVPPPSKPSLEFTSQQLGMLRNWCGVNLAEIVCLACTHPHMQQHQLHFSILN